MELKKVLVLFGLFGVFASGFGAESSEGMKPLPPPSMKLLMKGIAESGVGEEFPRSAFEKSEKNGPRNVILLLVDELYRSDVPSNLKNRNEYPVHGHLQVCPIVTDHSVVSTCDCDEKLISSIASLISLGQRVNMSTSRLYDISTSFSDPRARLVYHHRQEAPLVLQSEPSSEKEKTKIASKLKDTVFDSLLNRLSTARSSQPSVVHLSNVAELTSTILKDLNQKSNEHGHLAVVHTGLNELANILEFGKRYVSPLNTMTVIMNSCPQDVSNSVPFFAGGIGSEQLSRVDLEWLHDLPSAIGDILSERKDAGDEFIMDDFINTEDRNVRSLYNHGGQKFKRNNDTDDLGLATDGGERVDAQSRMMAITIATATITYLLKL